MVFVVIGAYFDLVSVLGFCLVFLEYRYIRVWGWFVDCVYWFLMGCGLWIVAVFVFRFLVFFISIIGKDFFGRRGSLSEF